MITTLFWDVDGVLVDTEPLHWLVWQKLFAERDRTLKLEEYLPLAGRGGGEILTAFCALKDIALDEQLTTRRWQIYRAVMAQGVRPIEANVALVREFLIAYPRLTHVAVSSSHHADVTKHLAAIHLEGVFGQKNIVTSDKRPGLRRKPAPDLYLLALEYLEASNDECLAFEDSGPGVVAAKEAGLRCVALPNGFTLGHDFSRADLILVPGARRDPREILETAERKTS